MALNKQEEITLMQNSHLKPLETNVRGLNNPIKWANTWDYKAGLREISFKTLMVPPTKSAMISYTSLDLKPVVNKVIYIVTIKRF
jgi:hypothetical protein